MRQERCQRPFQTDPLPALSVLSAADLRETLRSERLPIDQEPRSFGYAVVEPHRGRVRLVRLPVDAKRTCFRGRRVDPLDERFPDTASARVSARVEILQVAALRDRDRAAMEEIVRNSNQRAVM